MNQLIPIDDKVFKRIDRSIESLQGQVSFLKLVSVFAITVGLIGWWF